MPKAEEYAEAISRISTRIEVAEIHIGRGGNERELIEDYTLALRWLRVGAAMEAGTLFLSPPVPALNDPTWWARYEGGTPLTAPDPLTAAERAMGVAT